MNCVYLIIPQLGPLPGTPAAEPDLPNSCGDDQTAGQLVHALQKRQVPGKISVPIYMYIYRNIHPQNSTRYAS